MRRRDSFESFYYRYLAHGEGCGCCEEFLRTRNPALRGGHSLRELAQALRDRLAGYSASRRGQRRE